MNNEINTDFDSTNESEIHPENNEVNMEEEQRHILNVTELDESVLVEFAKVEDEVEQVEEESLDIEEEGKRKMAVVTPAFVSDCLETLEEIAMEGKEQFLEGGGTDYKHIPCMNDNDDWVHVMNTWIDEWASKN